MEIIFFFILGQDAPLKEAVETALPGLIEKYRWFHANPELSLKEEKTSARFAAEVRPAGWSVTEGIGGYGVVAILRNGEGPTVLARIDMDGLPVQEDTGLPYASRNDGVMHACGHDSHLAIGIGVAQALAKLRERWSGTVVLIGQPAEELGVGAANMLADPNYRQLVSTKPVACLSVHDMPEPAGTIALCPGWASANVDSLDVTVFGKSGHGAWPHETVDPIVMAAEMVTAWQTVVSRRIEPGVRAVVSVGSIHGGTKHNLIPDEVKMQLTVRSYEPFVREMLLGEIERIARKVAEAHRAPKAAEVKAFGQATPACYNDPAMTERMRGVFVKMVGESNVRAGQPVMGGEDFGRFNTYYGVPGLQIRIGGAKTYPSPHGLHSSKWAPVPEPTIRTGTLALTRACLELLGAR